MPIRVQCSCGKTIGAPDNAAGKAIRCPACGKPVAVPAAGGAKPAGPAQPTGTAKKAASAPPATRPAPAAPAATSGGFGGGDLSDLFDQEGFKAVTGPVCPACQAAVRPGAILCTACGLNLQTGERVQSTVAPVVAPSGGGHGGHGSHGGHGEGGDPLAHAALMMERDRLLQEKLQTGGGMPWWALLMILLTVIGLAAEKDANLGAMQPLVEMNKIYLMGAMFAGIFGMFNSIGRIIALIAAFKESGSQGAMVMFVPFYDLIFCALRWNRFSSLFFMLLVSLLFSIGGVIMMFTSLA